MERGVSRRTVVAFSMRRSDHPNWPSAMTWFLLLFAQDIAHVDGEQFFLPSQRPESFSIGRFWVTAEVDAPLDSDNGLVRIAVVLVLTAFARGGMSGIFKSSIA
jgi:hypothetical protein